MQRKLRKRSSKELGPLKIQPQRRHQNMRRAGRYGKIAF